MIDWTRVRTVFERAVALPDAERMGFVLQECGGDSGLREEVHAMLTADAEPSPHLDCTAPELHLAGLARDERRLMVGRVVGGFELREVLGEGGTATVYLGVRGTGDREERGAVKVLRAAYASSGVSARFRQERVALSSLDHPGIVRVLGAGALEDGRPFLVTEYVEGEPLDVWVEARGLDRRARLGLFLQVCEAVQHAHRHLVVHRDLKAANILVDVDGRPRMLDFGIAKLLDAGRDARWTDVLGRGPLTLECASPEQIRGGPVSTASDVYSLGVLLYRLVTGGSPYAGDGSDREALERAVLRDPPLAPNESARRSGTDEVPRDLATVMLCALRKEPGERYPTVLHLADDVRRFLEHRPVRARRGPPWAPILKLARRHPLATAVLAAGLFALAGAWVGTQRNLIRLKESEDFAWRAHRDAVFATNLLADVLVRVGAGEAGESGDLERLLGDAERRLEEELVDAAEAEARMRQALARVYLELDRPSKSEAHARRALELARTTGGLGWRDVESGLKVLAELAIRARDTSAAQELCRERLALIEERLGASSPLAREARAQQKRAQAKPIH